MVLKPGAAWLIFTLLTVTILIAQWLGCYLGWCSGVLVGDVVSLAKELDDVVRGSITHRQLSYIGVILLYLPIWKIAPFITIVVNLALIYAVLRVLDRLFQDSPVARAGAIFGVVANPYLWFVATGPNKDIPLLLITTLYAYYAVIRGGHRGTLYALLLAIVAMAFRDGYGVLLVGLALLNSVVHSPRNQIIAALVGAVSLAAVFSSAAIILPVMKRNLAVTEHIAETYDSRIASLAISDESVLMDVGLYLTRLAANAFSLPVRPQFMMIDGSVYPLGVAIWFYGVILAGGFLASARSIVFERWGSTRRLAALVLQILIAVSVSLFVQPRYLMVVLPLMTAIFATSRLNRATIIASGMGGGFLVVMILITFGATPPPATGVESGVPSFLRLHWNILQ